MIARAAHALQWLDEGRRVAAVTLVEVNGSAPMDLGATMLVDGDGTVDGSVTGGCVEAALAETALDVLNGGCPELVSHGISDDDASEVGLMCGGTVRLFVHALRNREIPTLQAIVGAAESGQDVALATLVVGPDPGRMLAVANGVVVGSLGGAPTLDNTVESDLRRALQTGESSLRQHHVSGALGSEVDVFVESVVSPAAMIIVGAGDHSAAVAALAPALGYRPVICDPRSAFMRSGHLRSVAELVTGWPDRYLDSQALTERDVVLVFTHDPKLDEAALLAALRTDAGYVGALGSRRTQAHRTARLADAGASEDDIARVVGPCGLDIGAGSPSETAISILADVIARRAARAGGRLDETSGSIRRRSAVPVGGP